MHNGALHGGISTGEPGEDLSRFYVHLADGLHAMAQPLTVLRSSVAASAVPGITPDRHRRYLDISTQQVERACGLFECLQDLVIARQIEPDHSAVDLNELTGRVVEDQKASLQAADISLSVVKNDSLPPILGDAARTQQAFCAALKIAASISSPGDVIEVQMRVREEWVECILQNRRRHGRNLNSSQHLSLALAETNIRSQQGEYLYVVDPFCVSLALHAHNVNR
jgi:signal transduction histidine kinase